MRALPLSLLCLLALASPAGAATLCVGKPGCDGTDYATLEDARQAAVANSEDDRIEIGPGVHAGTGFSASAERIDIVGSGRGQTFVTNEVNTAALALVAPGGTVSSLTLRIVKSGAGIDNSSPITVSDVDVESVFSGGQYTGIALRAGGTLKGVSALFDPAHPDQTYGFAVSGPGAVLMEDVRASGRFGISVASGSGPVTLRRVRAAGLQAVIVRAPGNLTADNLLATSTIPVGVEDSGPGLLLHVPSGSADSITANLRHTTLVGHESNGDGLEIWNQGTGSVDASLIDTVTLSRGGSRGYDIRAVTDGGGGPIDLALQHSAARGSSILRFGDSEVTYGAGNIDLDRSPANLDADGRPAAGSVLIDNGTPGALDPAFSPVDVLGATRLADGDGDGTTTRDVGAHEAAPGTSAAHVTPTPLDGVTDTLVRPASRILKVTRKRVRGSSSGAEGVSKVVLAVVKLVKGRRCRYMEADGRFGERVKRVGGACPQSAFALTAKGTTTWTRKFPRRLRKGRYLVRSMAQAGQVGENVISRAAGNEKRFRVRKKR